MNIQKFKLEFSKKKYNIKLTIFFNIQGAPKGIVRIGIAKPLPMTDFVENRNYSATESFQDELRMKKSIPDLITE